MGDHAACDRLGNEEAAAQIRIEHKVPVVPGDFERRLADIAACVVHEDVNLPEGCFGLSGHSLNTR